MLFRVFVFGLALGAAFATTCPKVTCADGSEPVDRGVPPVLNGCGPETVSSLSTFDSVSLLFNSCCNKHDTCYGTVGNSKNDCDVALDKCLKKVCNRTTPDRKTICNANRSLINHGLKVKYACEAFAKAQIHAGCPEGSSTNKKKKNNSDKLASLSQ
eukprot:TRINITY_DN5316_c0_g3_i1.p1 TRINITY_DN5316_c0_g3~~TRINITY_DN5316_c0_g3_i1.p1  ORF type:complete len:157 (+),score=22.56 TRINITY_DN5316_c0_g3_i1:159-629(+)